MKHLFLIILSVIFMRLSIAQEVPKKILLEHFTNTYCGTCANVNPGFYNVISSFNEVVHVAYHPSSPYAGCPLNQHNMTENDARTNFYNIYGSTPKVVMNGNLQPFTSNLVNASTLNMEKTATTPFSIEINQFQAGADSIYADITINTLAASSTNSANLIVLLGEKTLNFNAQNGENVHYDVFRKFLSQNSINLPANGSSISFTFGSKFDQEWTPSELTTTVILQESNQNVLQSEQSSKLDFSTGINVANLLDDAIYPNPAKDFLFINNDAQLIEKIEIYSIIGSLVREIRLTNTKQVKIPVAEMERGNYIMRLYDKSNQVYTRKIVLSN